MSYKLNAVLHKIQELFGIANDLVPISIYPDPENDSVTVVHIHTRREVDDALARLRQFDEWFLECSPLKHNRWLFDVVYHKQEAKGGE